MIFLRTRRVPRYALFVALSTIAMGSFAADAGAATLHVPSGGDLQAALINALPGDQIILPAGAHFVGEFWLPSKPPGPVITIRSEAALPNRRITEADAWLLPTLASGGAMPALRGTNVSNWRLDGIRFESTPTGEGEIIQLQDSINITMDRLLIVASENGQKRAIRGNGQYITLTRSHIANIWRWGQDSQTFCAWDGAGPYTITDNYLEAASENIMFGGASSGSPDRVPGDILVEANHLTKRPEWRGAGKGVKNLIELKQARRAVIRNNLMERVWPDAQSGYAILLTVRNDQGDSPWAVVEDVLFEGNLIRDAYAGVIVGGYDSGAPSGQTTRITFRDNRFVLEGPFLLVCGEAGILTFDHNTVDQGGMYAILCAGEVWPSGSSPRIAHYAAESLTITNSLANHSDYGLFGDGVGIGTLALSLYTLNYVWTHNVLAGEAGWGQVYPAVTWQPTLAEHQSQFQADQTLVATSIYRAAGTDGHDLGARYAPFNSESDPMPAPPPPPPDPDPVPPPATPEAVVPPMNPPGAATSPVAVVEVMLVNAQTGMDIGPADNAVIPVGMAVALRATTNPGTVGSVRFNVNGVINVETAVPYAMPGDSGGIFQTWSPAAGTYTVTATPFEGPSATGAEGTSKTIIVQVASPEAPAPQFAVVEVMLVNAQTGMDIGPADNAVIPVGMAVALRATTNPGTVGSVRFNVNGVINVETAAPYAMPGDSGGVFQTWSPAAGTYTVTATPFEGPSATGAEGTSKTITVHVASPEG